MPTADKNIRHAHDELMKAIDEAPEPAPCQMTDPDLFFSEVANVHNLDAVKMCKPCPVKEMCADFALWHFQMYGVWGGTSPDQRIRKRQSLGIRKRLDHPKDLLV